MLGFRYKYWHANTPSWCGPYRRLWMSGPHVEPNVDFPWSWSKPCGVSITLCRPKRSFVPDGYSRTNGDGGPRRNKLSNLRKTVAGYYVTFHYTDHSDPLVHAHFRKRVKLY